MPRILATLRERRQRRRAEREAIEQVARSRIRAGEVPADGDDADRNVVGGALSQRPH